MDPVSLVAGGIAFTQAAVAIGKGIAILRSMANASLEFCDLINEFETLRVVIESNRRVIEDIYNDAALQRYRPDLDRICLPLSQNVNQFEASAAKLLRSKDGLNKLGQKKISKRSWHTARRELYTLRDQCRKNQQELAAVMNADSLAQIYRNTQSLVEINLKMDTMLLALTERKVEFHSKPHEIGWYGTSREQKEGKVLINEGLTPIGTSTASNPRGLMSRGRAAPEIDASAFVEIYATARSKCERFCRCQCHRTTEKKWPKWLQPVVGSLFIQYNSFPVLDSRPCNSPLCNSNSAAAIRVQYLFPRWALSRAMHISMAWCSLAGTGASLHLKVPRVNELPNMNFLLEYDRVDIFRSLISNGKLLPTDVDDHGNPWMLRCVRALAMQSASILIESGFDITMSNMSGESAFSHMISFLGNDQKGDGSSMPKSWANAVQKVMDDNEPGYTLIHKSLIGLAPISLERAISEEPHAIDTPDFISGSSPLLLAIEIDDTEAVRRLLNLGCNVNLPNRRQDLTPLMNACIRGNEEIIQELISKGADIHAGDNANWTALHHAANSHSNSIRQLLGSGANPNARGIFQETPLHVIARNISGWPWTEDNIRALHQASADPNAIDKWADTPLMKAIQLDNVDAARALASLGSSFDKADIFGLSVLHLFIESHAGKCIRELAASHWDGIDPDIEDDDGDSPLDMLKIECEYDYQGSSFIPPPIHEVIGAAELIVEIRERNWERQLFLDAQDRFTADGSHQRLKLWIRDFQEWLKARRYMPNEDWDPKRMPWHTDQIVREGKFGDVDLETWSVRKAWWEEQSDFWESDEDDTSSEEDQESDEGEDPVEVEDGETSDADDSSDQDEGADGGDSDADEAFFDALEA